MAGLYVHLPFCATRCNYCDFATAIFQEELSRRYLAALVREIRESPAYAEVSRVDTVYFGGGTPSLIPEILLREVLEALASRFCIVPDAEITLEMNPSTAETARIPAYRAMGINRLSIGVQSFQDAELAAASRAHTGAEACAAVRFAAEQDLTNVSVDLMIGLPGQSNRSFSENVKTALHLPLRHLSIYMLELHTATPLHEQVARGGVQIPPEEMVTEAYASLVTRLAGAGLKQYELSNFARAGFESRHNMKYWKRRPVIGFGLSAASFDGAVRWRNTRSLGNYMQRVEAGLPLREEEIRIGEEESLRERLFLGLRLREGVPQEWLRSFCLGRERLKQRWDLFRSQGWVELSGDHWRLTTRGFLVSNEILSELV